jgi:hypothetical protein
METSASWHNFHVRISDGIVSYKKYKNNFKDTLSDSLRAVNGGPDAVVARTGQQGAPLRKLSPA